MFELLTTIILFCFKLITHVAFLATNFELELRKNAWSTLIASMGANEEHKIDIWEDNTSTSMWVEGTNHDSNKKWTIFES
jgi:hypothetical protein